MTVPAATALYAGILTVLFIALAVRVIRARRAEKTGLGTGSDRLQRAIRAHANFAEYTPLAILLMGFVEMGGAPPWQVHGLGLAFLAGRLLHAFGISRSPENYRLRTAAMMLTFFVLVSAAIGAVARLGVGALAG